MFDVMQTIQRIKQLRYDAIHGLPDTTKPKQSEQRHISKDIDYDAQAEYEGVVMARAYRSHTMDFGKTLKCKSQHRAIGRNW